MLAEREEATSEAFMNLANYYSFGTAFPEDYAQAIFWTEKAIEDIKQDPDTTPENSKDILELLENDLAEFKNKLNK
ncbi:hypothetical protein Dip510_000583 [Elusimicrobium posterum]|uniref:hypothetical protein n=1 Tax=Elusimicrobium posterum TaxID=3116653 RepID=UPI003C7252DA